MQFQKVNEGGVRRDDGVSIQIKHPEYLEYRDGACVASISVDYDPGTRQITVYASQADTWVTPDGMVQLPASRRQQMAEDLKDGLALLKGKFVVV